VDPSVRPSRSGGGVTAESGLSLHSMPLLSPNHLTSDTTIRGQQTQPLPNFLVREIHPTLFGLRLVASIPTPLNLPFLRIRTLQRTNG
jgi:hypothetical protein